MQLNTFQKKLNHESPYDFTGLKAIFINCTLKRSPSLSHTEVLMKMSQSIMEANGIKTQMIRAVDHQIAFGVYPDMKEHGWQVDEWPAIQEKVMDADILILGTPIWLGEKSSVATMVIERLYGYSSELNDKGQYAFYGRTGWIGEAGPGPSYLDKESGGIENDFTTRNTTFMTWNLMHMALMLRNASGIPPYGNQRDKWDSRTHKDHPNPEYRT